MSMVSASSSVAWRKATRRPGDASVTTPRTFPNGVWSTYVSPIAAEDVRPGVVPR